MVLKEVLEPSYLGLTSPLILGRKLKKKSRKALAERPRLARVRAEAWHPCYDPLFGATDASRTQVRFYPRDRNPGVDSLLP